MSRPQRSAASELGSVVIVMMALALPATIWYYLVWKRESLRGGFLTGVFVLGMGLIARELLGEPWRTAGLLLMVWIFGIPFTIAAGVRWLNTYVVKAQP